jgi:hypothetical protein
VIIILCLAIGLALRLASGRPLRGLAEAQLRGETLLLVLLVLQAVVPLAHLTGTAARVAFFAWLATFASLIVIAWINRQEPGIAMLGTGLLLNLVVILANRGMPVFLAAVRAVNASTATIAIPAGDFVHVLGGVATRLPWLTDVVPLPGPAWLRAVASPGDLLLFAGIVAYLGLAGERGALRGAERVGVRTPTVQVEQFGRRQAQIIRRGH